MRERAHLRWVLPEDEEPLLDALARLSVGGGLGRRHDSPLRRLVPRARAARAGLGPAARARRPTTSRSRAAALRARLDEALAAPRPLTADERRARAGLLSRQLTLR